MGKSLTAAILIALGSLSAPAIATALPLPACAEEDGNTNGQPCTWTDPDTGVAYRVNSAAYR